MIWDIQFYNNTFLQARPGGSYWGSGDGVSPFGLFLNEEFAPNVPKEIGGVMLVEINGDIQEAEE